MIENVRGGGAVVHCDQCPSELAEVAPEETFAAAWQRLLRLGWSSYVEDEETCHSCPGCSRHQESEAGGGAGTADPRDFRRRFLR